MIALSFSGWKDSECPFRFNALRIAKTYKEPENDAMQIGSAFAEIADKYRKHCFLSGINSNLNFLDDASAKSGLEGEPQATLLDLIEKFKSSQFAIIPVNASWWATEERAVFDADLRPIKGFKGWTDKNAAFRAVVDFVYRVGDQLYIIDDKTGWGTPDQLQLKIYAALIPRWIGMSPEKITVVFNNVGSGHKGGMELTLADLADVDDLIKAKIAEVNAWTEYPARACDACKWCSVPGCPKRDQATKALVLGVANEEVAKFGGAPTLVVPDAITNQGEAERALQFVVFADAVVDSVKELLREYVESNGAVVSAGKIAELKPNEPWKATSIEKVVKTMAAYGIPASQIWESLSITESAAEKLLKKHKMQDRLAMVLHYGERKSYKPKFSITNRQTDRL